MDFFRSRSIPKRGIPTCFVQAELHHRKGHLWRLDFGVIDEQLYYREQHVSTFFAFRIKNVSMSIGVNREPSVGPRASSVEQCFCPRGYKGLSCEYCSFGYTRSSDGSCTPCDCSGTGTSCHPESGICMVIRFEPHKPHVDPKKKRQLPIRHFGN